MQNCMILRPVREIVYKTDFQNFKHLLGTFILHKLDVIQMAYIAYMTT